MALHNLGQKLAQNVMVKVTPWSCVTNVKEKGNSLSIVMNVMVLEGKNAPGVMAKAEKIAYHVLELEGMIVSIALALVVKDAVRVMGQEETPGMTPVVQVAMVVDLKIVMTVTVEALKSVVCVGGVAMKTVHLVMGVVMMIVMNVMDMENCVWIVTDAMAMAS